MERKTFFKPTDGNSYIKYDSCHYKKWKDNIPKNQLLRVCRNCSNYEDYMDQSRIIERKLKAREYPEKLMESKKTVASMDRLKLLKDKASRGSDNYGLAFITKYNDDAGDIKCT